MTSPGELFAGYPAVRGDEAVGPTGVLVGGYAVVGPELERLGATGLTAATEAAAAERHDRGLVAAAWADGRRQLRPLPLDLVPRVLSRAAWQAVAAGVEQRHRALGAFLVDSYRRAGRRRSDPDTDRAPEIVRAGLVPSWAVAHSPGRHPEAVGLAWPGQQRATVAACDVQRTAAGGWIVSGDDLRVPVGLGFALANRDSMTAALPDVVAAGRSARLVDPWSAVPLLREALAAAAPPTCSSPPLPAVLVVGEPDAGWFEHRLLAEALGAPLVRPADLWPRLDGGIEASVGGERLPVDVVHIRSSDAELTVHRTPTGQSLWSLLAEAVRAGRLGLANVPGNGLADDTAMYAYVPAMIRFYLGEEPLLGSVATWVLADDGAWAEVRTRLHELVVIPLAGYGGGRPVVGPESTPAELAQLQAEVSAAPHRFVAQEPVASATVPTLVEGRLVPRQADLRVFSVAGPRTRALPAPLTRISLADGSGADPDRAGATKDTWLLG